MIEIKNSIVYFYTQKLEGMMMRKKFYIRSNKKL